MDDTGSPNRRLPPVKRSCVFPCRRLFHVSVLLPQTMQRPSADVESKNKELEPTSSS